MTTRARKEKPHVLSPEEKAAVEAGRADFAAGRFLTEEEFRKRNKQFMARLESRHEKLSGSR
jgi:hypothetical protein